MSYQRGNRQGIGAIDADENPMWSGADDPMFQRTRAERAIASNVVERPALGAITRVDLRTGGSSCTPAQVAAIDAARRRVNTIMGQIDAALRRLKVKYPNMTAATIEYHRNGEANRYGLAAAQADLAKAIACGKTSSGTGRPRAGASRGSSWASQVLNIPRGGLPSGVPAGGGLTLSSGGGSSGGSSSGGGGGGTWSGGGGGGATTAYPDDQVDLDALDPGPDDELATGAKGSATMVNQAALKKYAVPAIAVAGGLALLYFATRKR